MKTAIRLMLPCALLVCSAGARAQALFTMNVPVDVKEIPALFTSISVSCRLYGVNQGTGKRQMIPIGNSLSLSSTVPLVNGQVKTMVSIVFDKKLLPLDYQTNPARVTDGDCNFSLDTPQGGVVPGFGGQSAAKPGAPFLAQAPASFSGK